MGAEPKFQRHQRAIPVPRQIPKGRWRTTRTAIIHQLGEPSRIEVEMVDRMILNLVEAETALKVAAKEPYITGSRDQVTEHPGFRIAARCESTAIAIATKLGVVGAIRQQVETEEEAKPEQVVEDELAAIRNRKAARA